MHLSLNEKDNERWENKWQVQAEHFKLWATKWWIRAEKNQSNISGSCEKKIHRIGARELLPVYTSLQAP